MKLLIIQPLLPKYDCDFLNGLLEKISCNNYDIDLEVYADIASKDSLNQYDSNCNFKVKNIGTKNVFGLIFRPGLINALYKGSYDIVVFNGNPREITQVFLILFFSLIRKKFYVWGMFHRIGGARFVSNFYYRTVGLLAKKCLCYSRVGAQNLVSLGVNSAKIGIVGTAIDQNYPINFSKNVSQKDLASFKLINNLNNYQVVLQVVRLSRYKKPELLIHAAELLLSKRKDLLFVLIGSGEMYAELYNYVESKSLTEYIRFLGPVYDENILSKWFKSSICTVVPTCIGLSAHHSMSYGVPVITDDSFSNQASEFDILYPGLNGIVYKSGCFKSLADSIECIIEDPIYREVLAKNSFITASKIHTLENKISGFLSSIDFDE